MIKVESGIKENTVKNKAFIPMIKNKKKTKMI
jgi:hypothetical protein